MELVASQLGFTHTAVETSTVMLDINVNDENDATIDAIMDAMEPAIDSSSMNPDDCVHIVQVCTIKQLHIEAMTY